MNGTTTHLAQITTIDRHILHEQQNHPDATGTLTSLLYDLALAGKFIASKTMRAGLEEILGRAGAINVQGEEVTKLDRLADNTIRHLNEHTGRLAVMASEEHEGIIPIPEEYATGKYVLLFDPLDGSSNVDYNVSIGTIFAIYRRKSESGPGTLEDCLQPGRDLVAAGYITYGASTMFVYSAGEGVHGFTLDMTIGEFLLTHPNMRIPAEPLYYSVNQGREASWSEGVQRFTQYLQGRDGAFKGLSHRYVGSMIADVHRTLLAGGIYYYPSDSGPAGRGKLRLAYEAAPMAFLVEQAGGYASDGARNILDIQPESLHQRTEVFIGSRDLVEKAEELIRQYG
jgi:fructose-1,6-bisphosphatase I